MKRGLKLVATLLSATVVMSSGLFMSGLTVRADGIAIDEKNFPDENFRMYVGIEFDEDGDQSLSSEEIKKITTINCDCLDIGSLKGVENFTSLKMLSCRENRITSLDLSANTMLYNLDCSENQLKSLDVSKNTALNSLFCVNNMLTSIDISNNTKLKMFACSDNQITSVDLSKNTYLNLFECDNNKLTSIDISKNTKLTIVSCANNQLKSLDISNNKMLEELNCTDNQITNLDVSANRELFYLLCYKTQIKSLDISNCKTLVNLYDNEDMLTEVYYLADMIPDVIAWASAPQLAFETYALVIAKDITLTANGRELYPNPTTPTPGSEEEPEVTPETEWPDIFIEIGAIPTAVPTTPASQSVASFVERCYSVALGRSADEAGYNYWLDCLNDGFICGAQAGYGFIFSDEYKAKETTNEQFVNDLYSMYFGRVADEAGFKYWVDLLDNEIFDREEVFAGFANSTEFDNLCGDYGVVTGSYIVGVSNDQQGGVNSFVARLYNICLNRRPDIGGQSGWVDKLIGGEVTGTTCAYGFVFSPEFIGQEPTNEEFVAYMYRAFFGREPDLEGFTSWVMMLYEGASYEDVFAGFSGSAEFANLCGSYGIVA